MQPLAKDADDHLLSADVDVDTLLDFYLDAMTGQAEAEAEVGWWADRRATAVARLHRDHGWSYSQIADAVYLSRARVQQLAERGRTVLETLNSAEPPLTEAERRAAIAEFRAASRRPSQA